MFWCICGIVLFSDGTTWTLYAIQNALMTARFGIEEQEASYIVGVHFLMQIFLRPIIGYIADQKGYRAEILMGHTILQIIFGAIMMFYPFNSNFNITSVEAASPEINLCQVGKSECYWPIYIAYFLLAVSSSMMVVSIHFLSLMNPPKEPHTGLFWL